jgi:hypothetical protein
MCIGMCTMFGGVVGMATIKLFWARAWPAAQTAAPTTSAAVKVRGLLTMDIVSSWACSPVLPGGRRIAATRQSPPNLQ